MTIHARFKAAQTTGFRKPLPSLEALNATFEFDAISGDLIRKSNGRAMRSKNTNGYYLARVGKEKFIVHRIIWKMCTGSDPAADIDHIDCVRTNNRLENLRLATAAQNSANRKGTGASGYRGVTFSRGRWHASMRVNGRKLYLGASHSLDEAAALYREAAKNRHGDFCHASVIDQVAR